jgi:hypothetical protein
VRYSRIQIAKALLTARALLKGPVRPAAKVAEVLSPYMDCTEVGGAKDAVDEADMRSAIFAVMAHAYRRDRNVQLAAQWYRRASRISPGDHAPMYAHMVSRNQLAEFYQDAAATLEEHQRRRRARPIFMRVLLRMVAWTDREAREIARGEKHVLEFLRQRTLAKAA